MKTAVYEPRIGDEFSFSGCLYKCISGGDCDNCDLEGDGCLEFACRHSERVDCTNVHFGKVNVVSASAKGVPL